MNFFRILFTVIFYLMANVAFADNHDQKQEVLDAAKEIVKEKLRRDREPLLEAQDVLFQRALETSSDTTAIVAEKQRLRDITNDVDSMTTEAQLKTKMSALEE